MTIQLDQVLLDDAARAGWLYYVGGRTQDEIARTMGVSRQRVQRLVSKAVADGLVRVHLEHPITRLMDCAARLCDTFELEHVRIAPDLGVDGNMHSVAPFAARVLEGVLSNAEPSIIGFGTGRALRAMIEQVVTMSCPHHRLVSVIGNIAPDGSASVYEVLMRLADVVEAPHYPLPTPVFAETAHECDVYRSLTAVQRVYSIAAKMNTVFVGVGQMDETAPLIQDGFLSRQEWAEIAQQGVVGEICGRPYDREGNYVDSQYTERMTSYRIASTENRMVFAIASGKRKVEPIRAAINGRLISALVTDEPTAYALLHM